MPTDAVDYYEAQRIAEEAARNAKHDAIEEARGMVDAERDNRRESEEDIRDGLAEISERIGRLEARDRENDLAAIARVEKILRARSSGGLAEEIYALGCELGAAQPALTTAQVQADVERYGRVAAWRDPSRRDPS